MLSALRNHSPALASVAGLVVAALTTGCGESHAPGPETAPLTAVSVTAVQRASGYEQISSYTGRVEAALESAVGFEIGGTLIALEANEGDRVGRGQTLARLDTQRAAARRKEAKATLDQTEAELALARATAERTRDAYSYKGVSRQQLDEAEQRVATLEASSGVAGARLESIDVDIAKATLAAPFDAVVVRRLADPGRVLAPGEPVLDIESLAAPEARIGVAPRALAGLARGSEKALVIGDRRVSATIKAIIPRRNNATQTQDVVFDIDPNANVNPGDLARLDIATAVEQAGFWLPLAALSQGPRGLWQALAVEPAPNQNGAYVLKPRLVEVLYTDGERAFARGTLDEGERLVSDGLHRVVAGQRVVIAQAAERSAQADRERDAT